MIVDEYNVTTRSFERLALRLQMQLEFNHSMCETDVANPTANLRLVVGGWLGISQQVIGIVLTLDDGPLGITGQTVSIETESSHLVGEDGDEDEVLERDENSRSVHLAGSDGGKLVVPRPLLHRRYQLEHIKRPIFMTDIKRYILGYFEELSLWIKYFFSYPGFQWVD